MPSPITTPGYRYATQKYLGDGVTRDFEFNFSGGYLDRSHVLVFIMDNLNRVPVQVDPGLLVFIGPNQIRIPEAQPNTKTIIIRRETPKEGPLLDFTDGAILNEKNLNTTTEQAVFGAAEMVDYVADLIDLINGINDDAIDALNFALQALAIAQQALAIAQAADAKSDEALALAQTAAAQAAAALAAANAAQAAAEAAAADAEAAALSAAAAQAAAEDAAAAAQAALDAVAAILAAAKKMEVALYVYGRMRFSNEEVIRYLAVRSFTVDSGLSAGVLQVAPSSNFILNLFKNGIVFGTITFNTGTLTGVVNIPTATSFADNDILSISTIDGDATAAGLSVTIAGTRI